MAPASQFHFQHNPSESQEDRDVRWDDSMTALHEAGWAITGAGPDGDYPVAYLHPDGSQLLAADVSPDVPFTEVYSAERIGA